MIEVTEKLIIKMCENKEHLKDNWTIEEITENVKDWDEYETQKDLITVIDSLEFMYKDIFNYGYLCVCHDLDYELELNFYFTDWYGFLMENIDSGEIIDIIYNVTDKKDWLFDDSRNYYVLSQEEAEKEAQNEFDYLGKEEVIPIALWYAENRKKFNSVRD